MDIKLSIDEARVMKLVMDGMSTRQIEDQIAEELREQVKNEIKTKIKSEVYDLVEDRISEEWKDKLLTKLRTEIAEYITPQRLAKEFKKEEWSHLFEKVVEPVLADFISYGLQEWLTLEIGVRGKGKNGKPVGAVAVVGTESWQYRKK